jgi:hypothetical protein
MLGGNGQLGSGGLTEEGHSGVFCHGRVSIAIQSS